MVIINGVQMLSSSMFSAIGKPLKGALLSLTRQVFFLIPLILILPLFFGIDGALLIPRRSVLRCRSIFAVCLPGKAGI